MHDKIAIDIVLLFPENINNMCKELNDNSNKENYISFKDEYHPHITLGMGSIFIEDLEEFKVKLWKLTKELKAFDLNLISYSKDKDAYLNFEVTQRLRELHENILNLISNYHAGDVGIENFFEMKKPSSLIDWVNNFKINSSYDKYHPHIILGIDAKEIPLEFPITFRPVSLGLFHLGAHGTCKELLAKFSL